MEKTGMEIKARSRCLLGFILTLIMVFGAVSPAAYAIPAADEYNDAVFDGIREKWLGYTIGDDNWDPSDPDYAEKLASLNANAADRLARRADTERPLDFSAPGKVFVDYPENNTLGNHGSWYDSDHLTRTYMRLEVIATAYVTRGTDYYQDKDTKNFILAGLEYMYNNHYNPTKSTYGNWYPWSIGVPMSLGASIMLMWDELTPAQRENYGRACVNWPDLGDVSWGHNDTNGIWRRKCDVYAAVALHDGALLTRVMNKYPDFLRMVSSGQGFYEDGTHIYHTYHMYNGGYGYGHLRDAIEILYYLNGSPWDVSTNDLSDLYQIAYRAYIPLVSNGAIFSHSNGREISRTNSEMRTAQNIMSSLMRLAESSKDEADRAYIYSYVKQWLSNETVNQFFNSIGTISDITMKNALLANNAYTAIGDVPTYHQYTTGDKVAYHSGAGFGAGLGMHSDRIHNYEIGDSNRKGWNINNGRLYIHTDDIWQHEDATKAAIDWDRLPGVTQISGTGKGSSGPGRMGAFAGGVGLDGEYGVSALFLRDKDNSLDAKKSYFFFDDEIVQLGSGIATSGETKPAETIIENIKLGGTPSAPTTAGAGDNAFYVNGAEQSNAVVGTYAATGKGGTYGGAQATTHNGVEWLWVEGNTNTGGSDYGAYFFEHTDLKSLRSLNTGKMSDLGTSNSGQDTVMSRNFLTIWQDHGVNPSNGKYAYAALPGRSKEQVRAYSENPDVEVIAQEEDIHAVYEKNLNILGVTSFADQKQSVDFGGVEAYISVDKPTVIMSREVGKSLELSIADPRQLASSIVTVTVNREAFALIETDPRVNVKSLYPFIKLEINTGGSKGKAIHVKFSLDSADALPEPVDKPEKPVLGHTVDSDGVYVFFNSEHGATYELNYGVESGNYTETIDLGGSAAAYITGLVDYATYYFQVQATNIKGSTLSDEYAAVFDDGNDYFVMVEDFNNMDLTKVFRTPNTGFGWAADKDAALLGGWALVRPGNSEVTELIYSLPGITGFDLNAWQSGEDGAAGKYAKISFFTANTLAEVNSGTWTEIVPTNEVAADISPKYYTDDYSIDGLENANYLKITIAAQGNAFWVPLLDRLTVRYSKTAASAATPTDIKVLNSEYSVLLNKTTEIAYSVIPSTVRPSRLGEVTWTVANAGFAEITDSAPGAVTVKGVASGKTELIAKFDDAEIGRIPITVSSPRVNLALNKSATASKTPTSAALAVDGDEDTRWGHSNLGANPGTISFTVDLGAVSTLTDLAILWESSRSRNYRVDTSMDGNSWTKVYERSVAPPTKPEWERIGLDAPIAAQRVRVVATSGAYTGNYGISIFEFQVYGDVPPPDIEGLAIEPAAVKLFAGETAKLSAVLTPDIAVGTLKWQSGNDGVAIVDPESGLVTAIARGTTTITVTDEDTGVSATREVAVLAGGGAYDTVLVNEVEITTPESDTVTLDIGETQQITAAPTPTTAANTNLVYRSSRTSVAYVDRDGNITARGGGRCVITVLNPASGVGDTLTVNVNPPPVSDIILAPLEKTLFVGDSFTIKATVLPHTAANKGILWSSSNGEVATVDQNGVVTALAVGNTTINAVSESNGTVFKTSAVRVDLRPIDLDTLKGLIELAQAKVEADHTPETWEPFAEALAEAEEVATDAGAAQAAITAAFYDLQTALDALVLVIDPAAGAKAELAKLTADSVTGVLVGAGASKAEVEAAVAVAAQNAEGFDGENYDVAFLADAEPDTSAEGVIVVAGKFTVIEKANGENSATSGASVGIHVSVMGVVDEEPPLYVGLAPSYQNILAGQAAMLTLTTDQPKDGIVAVKWYIDSAEVAHSDPRYPVLDSGKYVFANLAEKPDGASYGIMAVVEMDGRIYQATVEVNVQAAGAEFKPELAVPNAKVSVNLAKYDGVLVPFRYTGVLPDTSPETRDVELVGTGSAANTAAAANYVAKLSDDGKNIIISSAKPDVSSTKTAKNVTVKVRGVEAGTVSLSGKAAYPKITFPAMQLDAFYAPAKHGNTVRPAPVSSDGARLEIVSVAVATDKTSKRLLTKSAQDEMTITANEGQKAGNGKLAITLKSDEYKQLSSKKTNPNVFKATVKVINIKPKLKLSSGTLYRVEGSASDLTVNLLPSSTKKTLDYSAVKSVSVDGPSGPSLGYDKATGCITVTGAMAEGLAGQAKGKHKLFVTLEDTTVPTTLSVSVTFKDIKWKNVKITSPTKSIVVNTGHRKDTSIAVVSIKPSAADIKVTDWVTSDAALAKLTEAGIGMRGVGENAVEFFVTKDSLVKTKKAISVPINAKAVEGGQLAFSKPVTVKLSITGKPPAATAKLSGKIDIVNPASEATVKLTLKNTTSLVTDVKLVKSTDGADYQNPLPSAAPDTQSPFVITQHADRTFKIVTREGALPVPGYTYKPLVQATLANGQVVYTKAITIKPTQTTAKGWQSKKAVTLYKDMTKVGEEVSFVLATPAFATLGEVTVQTASLKAFKPTDGAENAFELRQNGINTWSLHFTNGELVALKKKGASLKASYNITVELWPDGAWRAEGPDEDLDLDGIKGEKAVALGTYNAAGTKFKAKSKPVLATIKVNIK